MIWRSDSAKSTFRNDGTLMMDIYISHTHAFIIYLFIYLFIFIFIIIFYIYFYLYLFIYIFIYLFIYLQYIYIHIGMLINDKHQGYTGDISWDIMI